MSDLALPEGMYITLNHKIVPSTGGRTRALMMRNRILTERFGVQTHLLTLDSELDYAEIRRFLIDHDELVDGMHLHNLYDWLRARDLTSLDIGGPHVPEDLPPLVHTFPEDVLHADGTVHYTRYLTRNTLLETARDYRRPDGSVYLRAPSLETVVKDTPFLLVDADGRPVRRWRRLGQLHTFWLKQFAGDVERVFVVADRRTIMREILPFNDKRFHFFLVLHNNHFMGGGKHWNSPVVPDYLPVLERIQDFDGMVTLTHQQRRDISERWGATDNLVVVPNATQLPELPDPLPARERASFAIVARLDPQKRLGDAIAAFSLVVAQRPEATLRIFGEGRILPKLQRQIDRFGLGEHVLLMGYDPRARESLLTSTAFLMTSYKEGYPMATLEALSYGCPVVSYDCKYGPGEQITDGVDGFIVPDGDVEAIAGRIVELIDDPALVERLSKGAYDKATTLTWDSFAKTWIRAFESSVERKPQRVRGVEPDLRVHTLGWVRKVKLPGLGAVRASAASFRDSRAFRVRAVLRLVHPFPKDALAEAQLTLDAVCPETGDIVPLPLSVERRRRAFHLTSEFDVADMFADLPQEAGDLRLRLRVVARNWAWQTDLSRPSSQRPNFEVVFDRDGTLELHRGGSAE